MSVLEPMVVLSQAEGSKDPTKLLIWLGIFIIAVVILGVAIMLVRRRVLGGEDHRAGEQGFFDELREMRDSGKMTPEEYDLARKSLASRLAGREGSRPVKPSVPPPPLRDEDAHG